MKNTFIRGFEKTAVVGALAKRFGSRILNRSGKNFVSGAKNVGAGLKSDPLGTAGKAVGGALTGGLVLSEGQRVMKDTQKSVNRPKGTGMTSRKFFSKTR